MLAGRLAGGAPAAAQGRAEACRQCPACAGHFSHRVTCDHLAPQLVARSPPHMQGCWASGGAAYRMCARAAPPGRRWRREVSRRCGTRGVSWQQGWCCRGSSRWWWHCRVQPPTTITSHKCRTCNPPPWPSAPADFRAVALSSWGASVLLGDGEGTLAHWDTGAWVLPATLVAAVGAGLEECPALRRAPCPAGLAALRFPTRCCH